MFQILKAHEIGSAEPGLLRLQQLLQLGQVLFEAVLHDLPGFLARLRFHLRKFAHVGDRVLQALPGEFGLLGDHFRAARALHRLLPFSEGFLQHLVAPLGQRLESFGIFGVNGSPTVVCITKCPTI